MSPFLGQILTLLTTLPGNLIYHLVLVFSLAGALQGSIQLWRTSNFPQARRTVLGLAILLGLQLVLFTISGLAWQNILEASQILPLLDRTVTLLSLIWITWLWAFPEGVRLADATSILLTLLALTLFGLTFAFSTQSAAGSFNLSPFDVIWQSTSLAMVVLGIVILVIRRPNGWSSGLAMLVLALCGHLASLLWRVEGDYPGLVRLMQLASFPLLLTLSQRFLSPSPHAIVTRSDQAIAEERRRYSTDPKTFHALMSLAAEDDTGRLGQSLTRGIAQAMLADLCFLITLNQEKELNVACGYDLIREESLGGTMIDKESVPMLASAIQRGRPLRLPASSTSPDLKGLGQMLGLGNPGHLLSVPVSTQEHGPVGSILILSPYSNRLWTAEDQTYLANVANLFIPILERGRRGVSADEDHGRSAREAAETRRKLDEAARQLEALEQRYSDSRLELDSLKQQTSQSPAKAEDSAEVLAIQEQAQRAIAQLKAENDQLRTALPIAALESSQQFEKEISQLKAENEQLRSTGEASASGSNSQLEQELNGTLQELARMQNSLAESNRKILELEKRPAAPITNEQIEVIASISQELRQPMSSIVGYTDLLLGESVGILGALQRKFIERIKASTERIGGLIDDLIQITNLDTGNMEFKPEPIDLNLIIDNAMAYTGSQIREKNITLRLDIPETPPKLQTDRDAFQQILIHLLQNASDCTPSEGTITLRVRLQKESEHDFLSLQVVDTGGGIPAEDLPRVFARRYRAEHSLIQGLGDTGVGLAIAKTLVEAQNGRIWVDTETGIGSTFSVLLPVAIELEEER